MQTEYDHSHVVSSHTYSGLDYGRLASETLCSRKTTNLVTKRSPAAYQMPRSTYADTFSPQAGSVFVGQRLSVSCALPPCRIYYEVLLLWRTHTHTPAFTERAILMKNDHENERMTNPPQQRTHWEGAEDKGRKAKTTRKQGARGGRKQQRAAQQAQQGAPKWGQGLECVLRLMNNKTPQQTQEKEGDATRKSRKQTHPRPWKRPGSALKGKEKAKSEQHRKADNKSGDGGEGDEQHPANLKKDTRNQTRTNLPGDDKDQPKP